MVRTDGDQVVGIEDGQFFQKGAQKPGDWHQPPGDGRSKGYFAVVNPTSGKRRTDLSQA